MTQPPVGSGSPGSGSYQDRDSGQSADPLNPSQVGDTAGRPYAETGYVGTVASESASSSSGSPSTSGDAKATVKEVAGTAKGEAGQVADTAVASGKQVAETAKTEAGKVAAQTKQQAASLLDTVRGEVGQQAGTQQQRIAEAVRSLTGELDGMTGGSPGSGPLTDLARQAARKGGEVADWLQDREPAGVLDAVRSYARRRPGTFLVLCGLAGVVAGRLTRSTVATRTSLDSHDDTNTSRRGELGAGYAAAPVEPASTYSTGPTYSTGVYGTSVESTEAPAAPPYGGDPTVPNPGYGTNVGTGFDRPGGDPTR
jgi:hypothetical protein